MKGLPDNSNLPHINKPETITGVSVTFLIISTIGVSLRLFVRVRERILGLDDLFVVFALLIIAVGTILTCFMPDSGMGKHFWTLDHHMIIEYFKHVWATNVTYSASATFIKLSVLYQYLRFFDFQLRTARRLTWWLFGIIAAWGIAFNLLALFSCTPIRKNWDWQIKGHCIAWGSKDPDVFFETWAAHNATNMLLDILVLLLPVPFLRELRLQGKSKAGLIGVFVLGWIVVAMSIGRQVTLSTNRAGTVPILDMTYHTPPIYLFSVLEINLAIMCASIPIFWPLVSSIAANKILVVNEVEIRSDRRDSQNIGFAEQGAAAGFTRFSEIELGSDLEQKSSKTSRLSMLVSTREKGFTMPTIPKRSASKNIHGRKQSHTSKTSSGSLTLGRRITGESQENFADPRIENPLSSSASSALSDTKTSLDSPQQSCPSQFSTTYVNEWDIPELEKDRPKTAGVTKTSPNVAVKEGNTTTVARGAPPLDLLNSAPPPKET